MSKLQKTFLLIILTLNLFLAFYSKPIIDLGDGPTYIAMSKTFLGQANLNLLHRSPLYSLLMAGLMLVFKAPLLFRVIIILQYLMVSVSVWLIYKIFRPLFVRDIHAMSIGLLFNVSLSTIYYANQIITEILTVFLLVMIIYQLTKLRVSKANYRVIALAVLIGLLTLARYNAIPVSFAIFILILFRFISLKFPISKIIKLITIFAVTYLMIINIWCVYNYKHYRFYGLFPTYFRMEVKPILSSLHPGNRVSEQYQEIFKIFIKAREQYLNQEELKLKGSLGKLAPGSFSYGLYSGNSIYYLANDEVRGYFNASNNINPLSETETLAGFYKEIYEQNKSYIFKLRLLSFVSGFRSSGVSLPIEYGRINTNILPTLLFRIYKVGFIFMSFFVFLSAIAYIMYLMIGKKKPDFTILACYVIVLSFWGANFIFNTVNDANRFKFPAEPFIIGLFIFNIGWILSKYTNLQLLDLDID